MPTINQLVKKKRVSKKLGVNKSPALSNSPQRYGTCLSVFTKTPRKPNSALRKVAKVRLSDSKVITVFIPGEGHNISRFSDILVSGRRIRDLPGIKYGALRGKLDLSGVLKKKNGRSKYGTKLAKPKTENSMSKIKPKSTMLIKKRKYSRTLRKGFNSFFIGNNFTNNTKLLIAFKCLMLYNLQKNIERYKTIKNFRKKRNVALSIKPCSKNISKGKSKSIRKTWVETKNLISGIKKSISKSENLLRLARSAQKSKKYLASNNLVTQNHYELLEVSQRLRIIRVLDLKTNKILRYVF
jgi:small subunit ribosomal protein S12